MCDLRNLCDFIIRESKWSHIDNLSNKFDSGNFCDFSKKFIIRKIGTVTCVIGVTCVISSLGIPNGLISIFSETIGIRVTSVISQNIYLAFLAFFWCNMCNLCD